MHRKRGQVSLFLIFGLIILAVFVIFLAIKNMQTKDQLAIETREVIGLDVSNVNNFINECVKKISEDSLDIAGKQGGYTEIKDDMLATFYGFFPFIYNEGINKLISKKEMENQISLYINQYLPECINNFEPFKGLDIRQGIPKTETAIGGNGVAITVEYPIKIIKQGRETEISKFISSFDLRLSHIYDIVNLTVERMIEDDGWIDATYMSGFDVKYTIYTHDRGILIFSIIDNESILKNKPYEFLFANRIEEE